jgi:hypothetical protein
MFNKNLILNNKIKKIKIIKKNYHKGTFII